MTFLPDGRLLVTEMAGALRLHDLETGETGRIEGVSDVVHAGQGGLADVILHPQFGDNQQIYISYVEAGEGGSGGVVALARLALDENGGGELEDLRVIWRQTPKLSGDGHFGLRIAFDNDGMLWISSSERQEFDPAQDMTGNLGKMVRLNADGSVPEDNPFTDQGEVAVQVWSLGHRNILGMAFDAEGRLWAHEMGPRGGDELNLIQRGANYGYPIVSNGVHYDAGPFPITTPVRSLMRRPSAGRRRFHRQASLSMTASFFRSGKAAVLSAASHLSGWCVSSSMEKAPVRRNALTCSVAYVRSHRDRTVPSGYWKMAGAEATVRCSS